jgi:hypothetical protein
LAAAARSLLLPAILPFFAAIAPVIIGRRRSVTQTIVGGV